MDFDSQSNYCTYQYIYSHDNVRFMCNNAKTSVQVGNVVRYCLSVNDSKGRNKIASGPGEREMKFYNNTIVGSQRFDFDGLYDSYFVNNIIVMEPGYRLKTDFAVAFLNRNVLAANCYADCLADPLAGPAFLRDPVFAGTNAEDPASFRLSKRSPLLGKGIPMDEAGTPDFFGNAVARANVGCYGGAGEESANRGEGPLRRLIAVLRWLLAFLKNESRSAC